MRVRRGRFSLVLPAVGLLAAALSACGGEPETLMGPVARQATPEKVKAFANTYLSNDHRVVLHAVPKPRLSANTAATSKTSKEVR